MTSLSQSLQWGRCHTVSQSVRMLRIGPRHRCKGWEVYIPYQHHESQDSPPRKNYRCLRCFEQYSPHTGLGAAGTETSRRGWNVLDTPATACWWSSSGEYRFQPAESPADDPNGMILSEGHFDSNVDAVKGHDVSQTGVLAHSYCSHIEWKAHQYLRLPLSSAVSLSSP